MFECFWCIFSLYFGMVIWLTLVCSLFSFNIELDLSFNCSFSYFLHAFLRCITSFWLFLAIFDLCWSDLLTSNMFHLGARWNFIWFYGIGCWYFLVITWPHTHTFTHMRTHTTHMHTKQTFGTQPSSIFVDKNTTKGSTSANSSILGSC